MRHPTACDRALQRRRYVRLHGDVSEAFGSILSGQRDGHRGEESGEDGIYRSAADGAKCFNLPHAENKNAKKKATKRAHDPVARLREICLALPEAHEAEAWGEPTFRVRNKLFAMHASASTHHGAGREAVWICANHVSQDMVIRAKPDRYF